MCDSCNDGDDSDGCDDSNDRDSCDNVCDSDGCDDIDEANTTPLHYSVHQAETNNRHAEHFLVTYVCCSVSTTFVADTVICIFNSNSPLL